jgi:hypothetical protein
MCGLAWAAGLRGFMAEIAGAESTVEWVGTFEGILLLGTVTGGLLGWPNTYAGREGAPAGVASRWLHLAGRRVRSLRVVDQQHRRPAVPQPHHQPVRPMQDPEPGLTARRTADSSGAAEQDRPGAAGRSSTYPVPAGPRAHLGEPPG